MENVKFRINRKFLSFIVTNMADSENPPKKKKLPPVGQGSEETEGQKRPVRKKKKKPTEETTNGQVVGEVTTPKKKKQPTTEDGEKPTPRKRKKRKPAEQADDAQPTSARSGASQEVMHYLSKSCKKYNVGSFLFTIQICLYFEKDVFKHEREKHRLTLRTAY